MLPETQVYCCFTWRTHGKIKAMQMQWGLHPFSLLCTPAEGRAEGDEGDQALPGVQEPGRQHAVVHLRGCVPDLTTLSILGHAVLPLPAWLHSCTSTGCAPASQTIVKAHSAWRHHAAHYLCFLDIA